MKDPACPACGGDLSGQAFAPGSEAACPACGQLLWVFDEHPPALAPVLRHEEETLDALHDERLGELVITKLGRPSRVVFDVRKVRFATSAGVGRLVTFKARLDPAQVTLVLRGVPEQLRKTLSTLGLDAVFDSVD
jgi:anti-anti-sigma regulatory factor